jgi:hypothetical protein
VSPTPREGEFWHDDHAYLRCRAQGLVWYCYGNVPYHAFGMAWCVYDKRSVRLALQYTDRGIFLRATLDFSLIKKAE